MINHSLLKEFKYSKSKVLVVTKYWNKEETNEIINEIENNYKEFLFWVWENRIEKIMEKWIKREKLHFIWKIQSKKIEQIIMYCSTIHSLENFKHAEIINTSSKKLNLKTKVFLQINIDKSKDSWIEIKNFPNILEQIQTLENIEILWISWMWVWEFTIEEKEKEFELLKNLRDKYLPWKLISAWTSRDYQIALKYGIEVIRIGSKIIDSNL